MKIGIKYRLFLVLLAATGLVALGMFVIMQWSINRGFLRYVNTLEQDRLERLADNLEQAYAGQGNWDALGRDPQKWGMILLGTLPEGMIDPQRLQRSERRLQRRAEDPRFPSPEPPLVPAHRFEARVVLLDAEHNLIFGPRQIPGDANLRPLVHQDQTVGYLGLLPKKHLSDRNQLRFIQGQKLAMALIAGLMLLVSALLALPLANRLVRPIRALASGTRRLSSGEYATRVPVDSADELGQLARDFNALALTLEKNEQARRQWVADISHELRTPLAVLRGEIEALQDGVRASTPEAIGSLHGEVMRLGRLVDDLYQLAVSDLGALSYRKSAVNLAELLEETLAPFRAEFIRKNIDLLFDRMPEEIPLFADAERLHQLFANVLDNALNYTDTGGRVEIRLEKSGGLATVNFLDSAPGVPEAELGRLFERLYRVEGSRCRATGGAGLGLAICRNIVEAHGGTIKAGASPLGGLWIIIELPMERTVG